MVLNTRHTGIVVKDIKRAIAFYEGLGMKVKAESIEAGPYIDQLVGLQDTRLEWAKLVLPDQSLVELLQYHSHPEEKGKVSVQQLANRLGCSHIAFTVDDISETLRYILDNGGSIKGKIQVSPDGNVKVLYCYDIEGNILEIVEELK